MDLYDAHLALVEAVNAATTESEHWAAEQKLRGFRECADLLRPHNRLRTEADMHYIDQDIDRPMCCGVFLDWKPASAEKGGA